MGEIEITRECPVCRKPVIVLYPHLWAYKRNGKYYCSWKCLREMDKERDEGKVGKKVFTKEQLDEVFQAAISGGSPVKKLEEFGSKNPSSMWYALKRRWKEVNPERYAQLPAKFKQQQIETPEGEYSPMIHRTPKPAETPEAPKVVKIPKPMDVLKEKAMKPTEIEGLTVTTVRGKFGEYHWAPNQKLLECDLANKIGAISWTVEEWLEFCTAEVPKVMAVLGVMA